jgi:hypothetical protein
MTLPIADRQDADAILTDLYLDALLAARDRRAHDAPTEPDLDPHVRFAAGRLSSDLARVHPSFRFEERLATRLAEVAARMRLAPAAGGGDVLVPLSPAAVRAARAAAANAEAAPGGQPPFDPTGPALDPDLEAAIVADDLLDLDAEPDPNRVPRPLLIGGAITSAALSLAGAAYVAWRRSHPGLSPMARAVRAVERSRVTRGAALAALTAVAPPSRGREPN